LQRKRNFEDGDKAEMLIYEKDDEGESYLILGAFVVRAGKMNDDGDWAYQLTRDGEHYNGEEWFSESELS
jgi:hypothetical protein